MRNIGLKKNNPNFKDSIRPWRAHQKVNHLWKVYSVLWKDTSSLVQEQTPNKNQLDLTRISGNLREPVEVARISCNTTWSSWHVSLYKVKTSKDQWRPVKKPRIAWCGKSRASLTVCGVLLTLFLNITCPLTWLFSAKHHVTWLSG